MIVGSRSILKIYSEVRTPGQSASILGCSPPERHTHAERVPVRFREPAFLFEHGTTLRWRADRVRRPLESTTWPWQ